MTAIGLGIRAVVTGDNGTVSEIEDRVDKIPSHINKGNNSSGGSGGQQIVPPEPQTVQWDISTTRDSSLIMTYNIETKTAVISGDGEMLGDTPVAFLMGLPESYAAWDNNASNWTDEQSELYQTFWPEDQEYPNYEYPVEKIIFEEGCTEISNYAFSSIPSLQSIQLPNSLVIINDGAFCDNNNLTEVKIPSGVTTISAFAFDGDTNLETVYLPDSVSTIEKCAFRNMKADSVIYCEGSTCYDALGEAGTAKSKTARFTNVTQKVLDATKFNN